MKKLLLFILLASVFLFFGCTASEPNLEIEKFTQLPDVDCADLACFKDAINNCTSSGVYVVPRDELDSEFELNPDAELLGSGFTYGTSISGCAVYVEIIGNKNFCFYELIVDSKNKSAKTLSVKSSRPDKNCPEFGNVLLEQILE